MYRQCLKIAPCQSRHSCDRSTRQWSKEGHIRTCSGRLSGSIQGLAARLRPSPAQCPSSSPSQMSVVTIKRQRSQVKAASCRSHNIESFGRHAETEKHNAAPGGLARGEGTMMSTAKCALPCEWSVRPSYVLKYIAPALHLLDCSENICAYTLSHHCPAPVLIRSKARCRPFLAPQRIPRGKLLRPQIQPSVAQREQTCILKTPRQRPMAATMRAKWG